MLTRNHHSLALLLTASCLAVSSCSTPRRAQHINVADYSSPIRVACVGDSITYGSGIKDREHNSYPAQLGALLGSQWEVRNFGVSGSTLLKKGDRPYWTQSAYRNAMAFEPDVVVIMLGTNDSKPQNWAHQEEFAQDYVALVQSFQALASQPRIWVCRPVPVFRDYWGITAKTVNDEIIPDVDTVAAQTGVQVIDLHVALDGKAALFPDGIHPNAAGASVMAETIDRALTGGVATH